MWWAQAVIYQIYPRSFQDSGDDGIGDLAGITARLDHVAGLGVDAIWLSPFYPSPNADFGYDVADYTDVDPAYGTLADIDRLIAGAHDRGLRVLVDFVPCHTSIEHPWFREHPEFYVWADAPANNWQASFGGGAWARDERSGRWYLHSFFPEQADLDWRVPGVRAAMGDALRFWRERGVDGFRLDAIDRLLKDPELRDDPPAREPFPLPLQGGYAELEHVHSGNAPDIGMALETIREAAGDAFLVGEVYLPTAQLGSYLEVMDVAFAFEALHAGADAPRLRSAIGAALGAHKLGWVLSNHDFSRLATRTGENLRATLVLFLSLPGPVFMLAGDEIGMPDGPGVEPPLDRAGRDGFRHPLRWDDSPEGGFTTGSPWLPVLGPATRNVAAQARDPDSVMSLLRRLIALRRELDGAVHFGEAPAGALRFTRGSYEVAINLSERPVAIARKGELLLEARAGDGAPGSELAPHGAWIARSGPQPA
jgi:alpha-glucosidase